MWTGARLMTLLGFDISIVCPIGRVLMVWQFPAKSPTYPPLPPDKRGPGTKAVNAPKTNLQNKKGFGRIRKISGKDDFVNTQNCRKPHIG